MNKFIGITVYGSILLVSCAITFVLTTVKGKVLVGATGFPSFEEQVDWNKGTGELRFAGSINFIDKEITPKTFYDYIAVRVERPKLEGSSSNCFGVVATALRDIVKLDVLSPCEVVALDLGSERATVKFQETTFNVKGNQVTWNTATHSGFIGGAMDRARATYRWPPSL
jgi:hypothetical protein